MTDALQDAELLDFWHYLYYHGRRRSSNVGDLVRSILAGRSLEATLDDPPCCYAETSAAFLKHFQSAHPNGDQRAATTLVTEWHVCLTGRE